MFRMTLTPSQDQRSNNVFFLLMEQLVLLNRWTISNFADASVR